jgi:hypothetical protein
MAAGSRQAACRYMSGDVEVTTGGSAPMTFRMSEPSSSYVRELASGLGALITGRRTFEVADGWGDNHAWGPAFVLAHQAPEGWPRPDSTVHFVSEGVESAVAQAKELPATSQWRCTEPTPSSSCGTPASSTRPQASVSPTCATRSSRRSSPEECHHVPTRCTSCEDGETGVTPG